MLVSIFLLSWYQSILGCLLPRLNTMTKKQHREERVCSPCTSTLLFSTEGSQGRNSNWAGTWRQEQLHTQVMEEYHLLPYFLWLAVGFPVEPGPPAHRWCHSPWAGLLPLISNWQKTWQLNLMGAFSQLMGAPFSLMMLACVKWLHRIIQYGHDTSFFLTRL